MNALRPPQPLVPLARALSYRRLRHRNEGKAAEICGVVEFGTAVRAKTLVATGKDVENISRLRRRWERRDDRQLIAGGEFDAASHPRVAAGRANELAERPVAGNAGQ